MAYPVVASSSNSGTTFQGGSGGTVALPSGSSAGDFLLLLASANCLAGSTNPNISIPVAFTTLQSATTTDIQEVIAWKYLSAGDISTGNIPVSFSSNSTGDILLVGLVRITGSDPTSAINVSNFTTGTGTAISISGVTPTTQCLYLIVSANTHATGVQSTSAEAIAANNPSWTEQFDLSSAGVGSAHHANMVVAYANQTAAGGIATGNATATLAQTATQWAAGIIAIQPPQVRPTILGSTFSVLTVTINIAEIIALFGSTFSSLAATIISGSKWARSSKSGPGTWTRPTKD